MGPGPARSLGPRAQIADISRLLGMTLPGVEMSGHLGRAFSRYREPPSSHIMRNPTNMVTTRNDDFYFA